MRIGLLVLALLAVILPACAVDDAPPPTNGTTVGILVAKGPNWIQVKAESDKEAIRYIPRWIGGTEQEGGGPEKATLDAIKKLPISNLVEVSWAVQENHRRIISVKLIAPEKKEGTVTGVVTAKGEGWLDVKPKDLPAERYMARWIGGMPKDGGGLEKAIVQAIAALKVGDTLEVKWLYDERKRVVSLTVTAPAPAAEGEKK